MTLTANAGRPHSLQQRTQTPSALTYLEVEVGGIHELPSRKHVLGRQIALEEKQGLVEGVVAEGVSVFRHPQEATKAVDASEAS